MVRRNEYRAHEVSRIIESPTFAKVSDISKWDEKLLFNLVAECALSKDLGTYLATQRNRLPHPLDCEVDDDAHNALLTSSTDNTLGDLGRLPSESLWMVIENMDLQSFLRFAQTNRMLRNFCQKSVRYRIVTLFLPWTLLALKAAGLQFWISVRGFCEELQQPKCRSCGRNGHLLFLPTCERICTNCLMYNPAYWCVKPVEAAVAFDLVPSDFLRLPVFHDHGMRFLAQGNETLLTLNDPGFLVPIKSALAYSIEVHGSRLNMKFAAEEEASDQWRDRTGSEEVRSFLHRFWRDTSLKQLPGDRSQVPKLSKELVMAQSLMTIDPRKASTILHYVPPRCKYPFIRLFRCKGCIFVTDHFDIMPDHKKYMGDGDLDVTPSEYERILRGRVRMVHTWEELQAHLPKCLGAGLLLWRYRVHQLNATLNH